MGQIGSVRYVLHQLIARGGMGEVFRATRVAAGERDLPVVVKRVARGLGARSNTRALASLLAAEAELMTRLRHPNVVQVVDFGPGERGDYFLILELVEGLTFGRLRHAYESRGEPLPLGIALTVLIDVLRGLSHVHHSSASTGQLVVHRDVSPENILLSDTGSVKLADFGVALVRAEDDDGVDELVVGKPRYMAPEQLMGGPIDARTDVFSVGVVLFEAITGDSPFAGNTEGERQAAAYAGEIRHARSLRPDVPVELAAVVRQACASRVENRFAGAARMLEALLRVGRTEVVPAERHELAAAVALAHRQLGTPSRPASPAEPPAGELRRSGGRASAFTLSLPVALPPPSTESLETLRGR